MLLTHCINNYCASQLFFLSASFLDCLQVTGQKPVLLGRQEVDSSGLCQSNLSTSNKQVNGFGWVGLSKLQSSLKFLFWGWVDESYFKKLADSSVSNSVNTRLAKSIFLFQK